MGELEAYAALRDPETGIQVDLQLEIMDGF